MVLVIAVYVVQIYNIISFPSQIEIIKGKNETINILYPFTVKLQPNESDTNVLKFVEEKEAYNSLKASVRNSYKFHTLKNGKAKIEFKLLGLIPIKNVKVNVVDNIYLVPGGNTIGVKLETKGVLVVALSNDLVGVDGKEYSPAIDAGIKIGDIITEINDIEVKDADHVIEMLNEVGEEKVKVKIERNKYEFATEILPIKCNQDNSYRLGIWVRDKTAGIGTLTFYYPKTNEFGALGHGITDVDTKALMPIKNGEIVKAKISSIEQGKKGTPGELRGVFFDTKDSIGKIYTNTQFGIYGKISEKYKALSSQKALPIGLQNEVKLGKAYILSTIEGNKIQKYEIEILKKESQGYAKQKSMIIKIVDEDLLKKTGGIVQGMSGSPIIQNNKIIGAVTHVFVNDPTKGYGIYINWMLKQSDISLNSEQNLKVAN